MQRIRIRWVIGVLLVLAAGVSACGPSQEEILAAERQAAFEALRESKQTLDAKRAELADALAQAAAAEEAEPAEAAEGAEEGAEAGPTPAEIAEQLEGEVVEMSNEFGQKLVGYINDEQIVPGEPLTETQLAAIRMKSAEDILLAQEYIDKGGDYKRAMRIYQDALVVDPGNEDLTAALARAEELRFMTEERFAAAKKGMSQDEVRAVLGQVNLRNIREYPERNVIAWFYPTNDEGGAAAVYFRKVGEEYSVYRADYSAVERPDAEG